MAISILLILFNKATFSYYHFAAPNVLTLSQNVCSLVFLLACKQARLVEFHDFSVKNLRKMLPLGLTFIAYMVFGMIAMKVVNMSVGEKGNIGMRQRFRILQTILLMALCLCPRCLHLLSPMYTTLRRTTVVFVMLLEYVISRKTSNLSIKMSVLLMILGALIAGIRDLNFDLVAYAIVVVYNVCTALYLVLINQISTGEKNKSNSAPGASNPTQKLDKYDFMFYNNLISIPMLGGIIACTGETQAALDSPYWHDSGFLISLLASSVLAFALNYTIFWNTAVNSALTQTVSGQAKDVVVVALGFAMFDDAHFDPVNILGVAVGFAGSIFYAMTKILPSCTVERLLVKVGLSEPSKKEEGGLPFTQTRSAPMGESRRLLSNHSSGSSSTESSSRRLQQQQQQQYPLPQQSPSHELNNLHLSHHDGQSSQQHLLFPHSLQQGADSSPVDDQTRSFSGGVQHATVVKQTAHAHGPGAFVHTR
jgi:solute carrier family 35 protein